MMNDGDSWLLTQHNTPAPGMVQPIVSKGIPRKWIDNRKLNYVIAWEAKVWRVYSILSVNHWEGESLGRGVNDFTSKTPLWLCEQLI